MGIDFAEEFCLVALDRPGEGVTEVVRVNHTPASLEALVTWIGVLEPDPGEVRVVLKIDHGARGCQRISGVLRFRPGGKCSVLTPRRPQHTAQSLPG